MSPLGPSLNARNGFTKWKDNIMVSWSQNHYSLEAVSNSGPSFAINQKAPHHCEGAQAGNLGVGLVLLN